MGTLAPFHASLFYKMKTGSTLLSLDILAIFHKLESTLNDEMFKPGMSSQRGIGQQVLGMSNIEEEKHADAILLIRFVSALILQSM